MKKKDRAQTATNTTLKLNADLFKGVNSRPPYRRGTPAQAAEATRRVLAASESVGH